MPFLDQVKIGTEVSKVLRFRKLLSHSPDYWKTTYSESTYQRDHIGRETLQNTSIIVSYPIKILNLNRRSTFSPITNHCHLVQITYDTIPIQYITEERNKIQPKFPPRELYIQQLIFQFWKYDKPEYHR